MSSNKDEYNDLNQRFINIKANLENERIKNKSLIENQKQLESSLISLKYNLEEKTKEYTSKEDIFNKQIIENETSILNKETKLEDEIIQLNNTNNQINKQNLELITEIDILTKQYKELETTNKELEDKIYKIKTNIEKVLCKYNNDNKDIINIILEENDTIIPDYFELPLIQNIFNSVIKIIKEDLNKCNCE